MQLSGFAAERRHAHRVLEQPACVGVVGLRRGQAPQRRPQRLVVDEPRHGRAQTRVRDLRRQELEEAVELRRVPSHRGRHLRRVGLRGGLERAHLQLQPVAEALDAPEDADGVALAEARVEQLDVRPDARFDAAARVDELQREVRRAPTGAPPFLLRDRVDALHDPVFGQ